MRKVKRPKIGDQPRLLTYNECLLLGVPRGSICLKVYDNGEIEFFKCYRKNPNELVSWININDLNKNKLVLLYKYWDGVLMVQRTKSSAKFYIKNRDTDTYISPDGVNFGSLKDLKEFLEQHKDEPFYFFKTAEWAVVQFLRERNTHNTCVDVDKLSIDVDTFYFYNSDYYDGADVNYILEHTYPLPDYHHRFQKAMHNFMKASGKGTATGKEYLEVLESIYDFETKKFKHTKFANVEGEPYAR